KEVMNKQVELNQGFNQIQLNVENLDGGIYFYRVSSEGGSSTGKIIKK
ncbi:MAG: T9SS type A sorting domain-containing protein, partial [Bacteroidales bacterium]|nr:T9SS type A sorting domain-containing protein [Bacteroidales bacterium]NOQ28037.1 T9SS type A sorting domain-containing protein [Bacteroidales bacterium]